MHKSCQRIDEVKYNTEYSLRTVQSLHDLPTFLNIKDMMEKSIALMKDLNKCVFLVRTSFACCLLTMNQIDQ